MRREDVVMTTIRRATDDDHEAIVDLSLRAWEPVFASMAEVVGPTLFRHLFTGEWRTYQADDVRRACGAYDVFVATDGAPTMLRVYKGVAGHTSGRSG